MTSNQKEADIRKTELLDAASNLVFSIGYEATTVEKIHQHIGVSKGAFYYYFKSKNEIIDAIIIRDIKTNLAELSEVLNDPKANTPTRLSMFFRIMRGWKVSELEKLKVVLEVLYSDANVYVRERHRALTLKHASPVMFEIISSGARNGFFRITPSSQLTNLVIRIGFEFNETIAEMIIGETEKSDTSRQIESAIALYQDAIEKILGAPGGSVKIINREFLKTLIKP